MLEQPESATNATGTSPAPTALTHALSCTQSHALLDASRASASQAMPYRGAMIIASFGDAAEEACAARTGAVVYDLGWRRRVEVAGEDRLRWLNGMVTNSIADLPTGASNYNLVLNAQGRIQGDCCIWRGLPDDRLLLEIAEDQFEALHTHLDRFIIMDDVVLQPLPGWTALGITGPEAAALLDRIFASAGGCGQMAPGMWKQIESRAGLAATPIPVDLRRETGRRSQHWNLWCREPDVAALWQLLREAGAIPMGCEAVERLRVVEGIPAFGIDFAGDTLPQETAMDDALHFSKGCYLGQEIVERIRSRGQVHRHLRPLEIFPEEQAPSAGLELTDANGKPLVRLTSVAPWNCNGNTRWFALGMVRAEAEIGSPALRYIGGSACLTPFSHLKTQNS